MPAVTQRVDDYLGGVSRQSDDKKLPGQVEECVNGYPDPTFGLTKRPGFQWLGNLGTGTTYDNSKWFFISRTDTEKYIGCITPVPSGQSQGAIAIWNAVTFAPATVTYGTGAQAYLTGARTDYDILTIQDKSIITNKTVTANKIADPTFNANRQGTIKITGTSVETTYNVSVAGQAISAYTSGATTTYDQVLTELKSRIDGLNISNLTVTKLKDSLRLVRTGASFTLTGTAGVFNNQLNVFQDQVATLEELPSETTHNHVIKIINSGALTSAFYLKYVAEDGVSGPGFYEETLAPDTSTGLDNSTMPHQLRNTSVNNFVFERITYTARAVGDDDTNDHPSFVGGKITQSFFHNNRLGFLSGDTVSMSQSAQFFNFYHTSAQTITDADPIDLSASTIKPVALHSVLPSTQGLVLFSANQQFLMGSTDGILTPSKTVIRTIANYEMDTVIDPVDTGTTINFISKTPSYTRVFAMVTRGENENPQVADIGKVVNEWIPSNVDTMIASAQNQFIAFSGQSSRYIYLFRQYAEGKEILLQTWFNWEAPGTVQTIASDSDELFTVTKQGGQFTLSKASLSQSPEDAIIVNNDGQRLNPCIDLYAQADNGVTGSGNKKVVFDSTNEFSKCYIPYANATNLTPVLIIKGTTATGQFIESGFTITPEIGSDSDGTFFKVPFKDLSSIASDVIVGYKYDFDVILPRTYYRVDEEMRRSDFTANLTIARMKFAVGLSGVMGFKLKSKGIRQGKREYTGDGSTTVYNWVDDDLSYVDDDQIKVKLDNVVTTAFTLDTTSGTVPKITFNSAPASGVKILIYLDEWYSLNPVVTADDYLANDIPIKDQTLFTLPIHQKTDNFTLRLFNDSPFPVSVNSMMWEGIYSPRFYRRT